MPAATSSTAERAGTALRGVVVAITPEGTGPACLHDRATLLSYVRAIARIKGCRAADDWQAARPGRETPYFVPWDTLRLDQAAALGIRGPGDLFGGVVPHAFVATKAISHPLVAPTAASPRGWNPDFAALVDGVVLDGHTVFGLDDALRAGRRLLRDGAVRIKPVRAKGGTGQCVASDEAGLRAWLQRMDAEEIETHGLVLEEHLDDVQTFSVGQVQIGDLVASYCGVQRLTRSNAGEPVFGGSDLDVARGGFDALHGQPAPFDRAIRQARRFDEAAHAGYPGFFASRRNYDVALGRRAGGWRSGVLEQSWRVGGATGPELAALDAFRGEPDRQRVRARCFEVYGDSPPPPAHAIVHFRGDDPQVGRLTKYTVVEPDVHAR